METYSRLLDIFDILLLDKNKEAIEETTKWLNKIDIHKLLKLDNLNNHYLLAVILKNEPTEDNISEDGNEENWTKFLYIHVLIKKYDFSEKCFVDEVTYINTIVISDSIPFSEDIYNWKLVEKLYKKKNASSSKEAFSKEEEEEEEEDHSELLKIIDTEDFHLELSLPEYYETSFSIESDIDYIRPYVDDYITIEDTDFLEALGMFETGLYFNINDVRWQIALRETMHGYFGNDKILLGYSKYSNFTRIEHKEFYFPDYNQDSYYINKLFNSILHFVCDLCNKKIGLTFYNNPNFGDLCDECYEGKKKDETQRKLYLKKLLILPGQRICFQNMLLKTKEHLKKLKLKKLTLKQRLAISNNVNRELSNYIYDNDNILGSCGICLDLMSKKNIKGGLCGHCFHETCVRSIGGNLCPLCRRHTNFVKLFI